MRTGARSRLPVSPLDRQRMEAELREAEERVALSALDGLSTHIAILDAEGNILAINKAWREFAREKQGGTDRGGVGANYFVHCEAPPASPPVTDFAEGVQAVLRGKQAEFSMEYPCQVRGEERWFHGKVTRVGNGGTMRVIVAHEDISQRVHLEREIVAVSSREQQRFGQELHDGLSQQLTGLKFKASLLEYQLQSKDLPESKEAKAISELLNQATDEASKLARRVQPVEMESRGLMMALKELAAYTENTHGISCTCDFRRPVFIHDNNVATNVYRIAEEAISNALKHGAARHIWIAMSETKDCVTLIVRDNGNGLPAKFSEEGGLGVHMMRYRARMIGGSVELRRNLNGGTTVTASFQKSPVPNLAKTNRRPV